MNVHLLYVAACFLSYVVNGLTKNGAFCPTACKCSGTELDCSSENIAEITWKFPTNTTGVNLSNNNLTQLNKSSFEDCASTLTSLDVSRNGFTAIQNDRLQALKELTFLNFSNNNIAVLPFLYEGYFKSNSKLRTLDLSYNKLPYIGTYIFSNLNALEKLYLDGNLLPIVSFVYFGNSPISTLSVKDNVITDFSFRVKSVVKTLDISGNDISIPKSLFRGSPDLSDLRIGHNGIAYSNTTFAGLQQLRHLKFFNYTQAKLTSDIIRADTPPKYSVLNTMSVTGGSLTQVELDGFPYLYSLKFDNLFNLTSLAITSCKHVRLNSVKLNNSPGLIQLKLVQLELTSVNMTAFLGAFDNLVTLNLSYNKLQTLPKGSMEGLLNLETLDLSNNRLTNIDFKAFASLPNLKTLDLSRNLLDVKIDSNFIKSSSIVALNLAYNFLEEVSLGPYWSLPKLQFMDVAFNHIKTLYPAGKSSIRHNPIKTLPPGKNLPIHYRLRENKWDCTCELYRVLASESMKNSCQNATNSVCYQCASPSKYARSTVFALKEECSYIETHTSLYVVILAVIGGLLVFLILLIAVVCHVYKSHKGKNRSFPSSPTAEPMVNKPTV